MGIKIQISIDYREHLLIEKLTGILSSVGSGLGIELEPAKNLLVGDVNIFVMGELGQIIRQLIIERKTFADMVASIKDGRYREQKLRLAAACQPPTSLFPARFIYLIESGSVADDSRTSSDAGLFYGSWVSMALRDNIPVVRVVNVDESVRFILRLAERLIKDSDTLIPSPGPIRPSDANEPGQSAMPDNIRQIKITTSKQSNKNIDTPISTEVGDDSSSNSNGEYTRAVIGGIKTKKGDNMTRELCHKTMLSIIPGISAGLCEQILIGYGGSISSLIKSLEITGEQTRETIISDLSATEIRTTTGKSRKLGPVLAQRIWDYLGPGS